MAKRLYIGNLSYETMEGDLLEVFSKYGKVSSCNLIMDRETGKSRGFAFVEMENDAEADKAIAEADGQDVDGRKLRVNEAKPRDERPRRDFGGGGGDSRKRDRF